MFAALSWLLDIDPARSSSSSETDSASYRHRRSSSSDTDTSSTGASQAVVPRTTFTDARGEAVAVLQVNTAAASRDPMQALSPPAPVPRRNGQPENIFFADLHARSSAYFPSADTHEEDFTHSIVLPRTVPVWSLSNYTSEAVSIAPLPSPAYEQAPTNLSTALDSLAEHGTPTAVLAPAVTSAERTLWASDGVVLSACFPASIEAVPRNEDGGGTTGSNDAAAFSKSEQQQKAQAAVAAPVAVESRRSLAGLVGSLKDVPAVLSVALPWSSSALHTTTAAAALQSTAEDVRLASESRIVVWDQDVCERRGIAEKGNTNGGAEKLALVTAAPPEEAGEVEEGESCDASPIQLVQHAAKTALSLPGEDQTTGFSLPSPQPVDCVVSLHPSNPFLMSATTTATTLPRPVLTPRPTLLQHAVTATPLVRHERNFANSSDPHSGRASIPFIASSSLPSTPPPTARGTDGDASLVVSLTGLAGPSVEGGGDPYEFMENALRQRTEELLSEGTQQQRGFRQPRWPSPLAAPASGGGGAGGPVAEWRGGPASLGPPAASPRRPAYDFS
ncbi:hypothetical protein ABL78_7184 [Leptomonas seymouri]|uniref:Uncharacterized protein n=1 Tax=Leptomonas seymouri TaxID=5684 RepID=A0A0N1IHG8_LEPSE|nr:hypothetical protein ABL78_7184 [Leptomonas seymouri]|eukprot:KPI83768.1 hypothetical protein ABL78_7184 [Leptomonas seymouri]